MHTQFKAISISHKTAPLAIRERVALSEAAVKQLSTQIKEITDATDVLVLSTCNRTEIYYAALEDHSRALIQLLGVFTGSLGTLLPEHFAVFTDHHAAERHLFEVSMGLHSQVIGDIQLANQVKHAYQWSADLHLAGPFLHRLMHTIFFTNKRVAQETSFRDGAASVAYATVELLEGLVADLTAPRVLVVGLGDIGVDVVKNLADRNVAELVLMNRTRAKAEQLAQQCGGLSVADFDHLAEELERAHVVISSVARPEPLITRAMTAAIPRHSYQFFIDLAVPRSVEAAVESLPGVLLYNVDDIRNKANAALAKRVAAIPQVQAIVDEALASFGDWSKEMAVSPTINRLKNALEQIRQEEMARHLRQLSPAEADRVDRITRGMMQKIIKLPVLQLKAACQRGEAETLIDVLNDLFDLEKQSAVNPDAPR